MGKDFTVNPGVLRGVLRMPSSKSELLRAVLIGSVARGVTSFSAASLSGDVRAAIALVERCGADVQREANGNIKIRGGRWRQAQGLSAAESAFIFRTVPFMAAFQGLVGGIRREGTLRGRPQQELYGMMEAVGMLYTATDQGVQFGYLLPKEPYDFRFSSLESSQLLSGLLMASPLLGEEVRIGVERVPSGGYVELTLAVMSRYGVEVQRHERGVYVVPAGDGYHAHGVEIGGDWSAASVFIAAAAYGGKIVLTNLQREALQPDRAILDVLRRAGVHYHWDEGGALTVDGANGRPKGFIYDATDCPDLIPALVLLASGASGESRIGGVSRLRGKECDRASALEEGFSKLGGKVRVEGNELVVQGVESLLGGVDLTAFADHRMAMVFGAAGVLSQRGVKIEGGDAVSKSYPRFWEDLESVLCAK